MARYVYILAFMKEASNFKFVMVKNRSRGGWEMPGGAIEPAETIEAAAKREFMEETGYAVELADSYTAEDGGIVFFGWIKDKICSINEQEIVQVGFYEVLPPQKDINFSREEYEDILRMGIEKLGLEIKQKRIAAKTINK